MSKEMVGGVGESLEPFIFAFKKIGDKSNIRGLGKKM